MNRDDASTILSAYRPGRDDARDPAFAEALAWLDRDAALAEWFAENQALDQKMRAAFATIQPPVDLKAAILAAMKTTPLPARPSFWRQPAFALAAGLVFAIGVGAIWLGTGGGGASMVAIRANVPALTAAHHHSFGTGDGNIEKIRQWLGAHDGIANFTLPRGLQGTRGLGCEVASIDGAKVSIMCFDLPSGGPAHLYVIDRSQLGDPPPAGHPEMRQQGEFATASWSDGDRSYILARRGDESAVRALL